MYLYGLCLGSHYSGSVLLTEDVCIGTVLNEFPGMPCFCHEQLVPSMLGISQCCVPAGGLHAVQVMVLEVHMQAADCVVK